MILILLFACAADTDETGAQPEDVVATLTGPGPWRVGYRESELTYADPDGEGERRLRLALWYPTEAETGDEVHYYGVFEAPGLLGDAAPAAGPFPLSLFSHGHQGFAENSGFLMTHLASHGFAVAAPDHTDNTFVDGAERTTEIYYQRPLDLSAVLDHLQAGAEGIALTDDPVVLLGHSFGGYTAFAAAGAPYDLETLGPACLDGTGPSAFCSTWSERAEAIFEAGLRDERVGAVVAMAPGDSDLFVLEALGALSVPVMLMNGDLDPATSSDGDDYWESLQGGADRRVVIAGGGHQVFTDFSGELDAVDGEIEAEEGFAITDAYALAWAWRALGDESGAAVLDGEEGVSEAVTLSR